MKPPSNIVAEKAHAWLDVISNETSHVLRRLAAAPLFVVVVAITFACGIGANAAVFNVVDAVILRPLPFPQGSQLVQVLSTGSQAPALPAISLAQFRELSVRPHLFDAIALVRGTHHLTITANGHPYAASGLYVTPRYLSALGIVLERGKLADRAARRANSIILSHQFSQKAFGEDPQAIGKAVQIDHQRYIVAGILRKDQPLIDAESASLGTRDVLLPFPRAAFSGYGASNSMWGALGLLAPQTTIAEVNKSVSRSGLSVRSLHDASVGEVTPAILLIFVVVAAILLLTCANVANMLIVRWSNRDQELAVRRALGATTARLTCQLLIETGILAFAGGTIGTGCAYITLGLLNSDIARMLSANTSTALDPTALLFPLGLVIFSALLSAIFPMLSLRSHDLNSTLNAGGRGGNIRRRNWLSSALVVAEIAVALALITIACLFVSSFVRLITTPLGVRSAGVVLTEPIILPSRYNSVATRELLERRVLARLSSTPGIKSAALSLIYPQSGSQLYSSGEVFGQPSTDLPPPIAAFNGISPNYFATLGIPVLAGRPFRESDTSTSEPVAIVNANYVRQFILGGSPLGKRIATDTSLPGVHWARVVGVVGDERVSNVIPDRSTFYIPLSQTSTMFSGAPFAEVYAPTLDPTAMGSAIHDTFASILPEMSAPDTFTFADRVANDAARTKVMSILVSLLALIGLALAVSGVFGIISYSVSRRIREFGIRIALGATTKSILVDVLRRALGTMVLGCAVGLPIALTANEILRNKLPNASALDPFATGGLAPDRLQLVSTLGPLTAVCSIALVCMVALVAALLPALRAAAVEPIECLRCD